MPDAASDHSAVTARTRFSGTSSPLLGRPSSKNTTGRGSRRRASAAAHSVVVKGSTIICLQWCEGAVGRTLRAGVSGGQ